MPEPPLIQNLFRNMMKLRPNPTKRVSSWEQNGGNRDFLAIAPGETALLAEIAGPAVINHFYVTMAMGDVFHYRRAILRMFWDGEKTPSVEVPIGDFFGVPFAKAQFFSSLVMSVNPGCFRASTDGLNSYFPMPFAKKARIELFNDSTEAIPNFWYHINYEEVDELDKGLGYFHASFRMEKPCRRIEPDFVVANDGALGQGKNLTGDENFVVLDAKGRGNYAGCLLQIDNQDHGWYGEGDDMIFIDGDVWPPTIHGTGTEEVFAGGAAPNEFYATPYCGFIQTENPDWFGRNAMYKFFVNDPIRFQKSIRVTLEHGHANNLGNDYAAAAYWYQKEPHKKQPALPAGDERLPRMSEECLEAARIHNRASAGFQKMVEARTISEPDKKRIRRSERPQSADAILSRDGARALELATKFFDSVSAIES